MKTKIVDENGMEDVKSKPAIIIDDIISTGGTIVNAINILKENGAKSIDVCCVHAVLANNGAVKIYSAGAGKIIATNSLSSDTSRKIGRAHV